MIEFVEFQSACRFMSFGYKGGLGVQFEPVCNRRDRILRGHSWGTCDEQHCPYFGIRAEHGEIYMNGEKIGAFNEMRIVLDSEEAEA